MVGYHAGGKHTPGPGWGMVEDGVLVKNSTAAVDQKSFNAYKKARKRAAADDAASPAKKAKTEEPSSDASSDASSA